MNKTKKSLFLLVTAFFLTLSPKVNADELVRLPTNSFFRRLSSHPSNIKSRRLDMNRGVMDDNLFRVLLKEKKTVPKTNGQENNVQGAMSKTGKDRKQKKEQNELRDSKIFRMLLL